MRVCVQSMPQLTIASFRVDFLWRIAPLRHRTHVLVYMRVRFLRPSLLRATISSQSISQSISCYTQLKQRLLLRFPPQGAAEEAHHAAADVTFALRIAKEAACRMPQRAPGSPASPLPPSPVVPYSRLRSLRTYLCE